MGTSLRSDNRHPVNRMTINLQIRKHLGAKTIAAPVAVALSLRLLLLLVTVHATGVSVLTEGDTFSYLRPGMELIRNGRFFSDGMPEIDRTPGYPIFAMLCGAFHGHTILVSCVQILLAVLSVILVARIANRIFQRPRAGLAAAWFFACDPVSIEYSLRLMSETLFVFLLLLFLDRMIAYLESGKTQALLIAALLLVSATYVRPVSYWMTLFVAVFVAAIQFFNRDQSIGKHKWLAVGQASLFLAVSALLLIPWQLRNFDRSGYAGFSSIVEKNLYFYEAAAVTATLNHRTLTAEQTDLGMQDDQYLVIHPEQKTWTRSMRLKFMRDQSMQVLVAHPFVFAETYLTGLGLVTFSPGATEFLRMTGITQVHRISLAEYLRQTSAGNGAAAFRLLDIPAATLVLIAFEGFLLALYFGVAQSVVHGRRWGAKVYWIALVSLYFLLLSGGGQAVSRLRTPAMPCLAILAGGGMAAIFDAREKRSKYSGKGRNGDPGRI